MTENATPVHLRECLAAVPAYKAGKPPVDRGDLKTFKMSSNENPFPPLPSVLQAVQQGAYGMNRYPDMGCRALFSALSSFLGVPADRLAVGTGSVDLLAKIVQITCEPGDEVVYAWRSFEAYPIVVRTAGAEPVQVPLDGESRHDLDAMADAITERTRVVIVCTPNNPTGPSVRAAELEAFIAKVPEGVLVVIDEAYLEFNKEPEAPVALDLARAHANVMVLRTFSKAYGLAGLRVGYAVAAAPVAEALRKVSTPFGVSQMAQDAVVESLKVQDELLARCEAVVAERERMLRALRRMGYSVPEAEGNFFWLPMGVDTMPFAAACDEVGLSVRPFGNEGVRVSVAEPEANDKLLRVAQHFIEHVGDSDMAQWVSQ